MPVGIAIRGIQKKMSVVIPHIIALDAPRCIGRGGAGRGAGEVIQADALAVAHDKRPGGEVPEPLAAAVDEQREHPDAVEKRKEIHDPYQVADGGWLIVSGSP